MVITAWKGKGKWRHVSGLRMSQEFIEPPALDHFLTLHKDPLGLISIQLQIHVPPPSPVSMGHGIQSFLVPKLRIQCFISDKTELPYKPGPDDYDRNRKEGNKEELIKTFKIHSFL
jgi:hypothetical protein